MLNGKTSQQSLLDTSCETRIESPKWKYAAMAFCANKLFFKLVTTALGISHS
jgi:hypothetical protein